MLRVMNIVFILLLTSTTTLADTTAKDEGSNNKNKDPHSKKEAGKKADDRGFDPCLFNASLAVCQNNKNSDNEPSK